MKTLSLISLALPAFAYGRAIVQNVDDGFAHMLQMPQEPAPYLSEFFDW